MAGPGEFVLVWAGFSIMGILAILVVAYVNDR